MKNIVFFPALKQNKAGIWYFHTNKINDYRKGKPCKGFGQIKYPEGSIYTGDIYFDGVNFNKLGNGQQDFTHSSLGNVDSKINEKIYKYVGKYDYRKTDWIYGNGVIYYQDINNKPSHFVKGYFKGLNKCKDYVGEFDYSTLLEGYSKDMEFDYSARHALFEMEKSNLKELDNIKTLFIGDSYFEFWHYKEFSSTTFYKQFSNALNLGLGGTTFEDWFYFVDGLKSLPQVENIIINLGFNDLHSNLSHKTVYRHFIKLLKMLRELFPNSKYYLLNVVHAPCFGPYLNEEILYNELIKKHEKKNDVTILDNYSNILNGQKEENCFASDLVHLNDFGYRLTYNLIKKGVNL